MLQILLASALCDKMGCCCLISKYIVSGQNFVEILSRVKIRVEKYFNGPPFKNYWKTFIGSLRSCSRPSEWTSKIVRAVWKNTCTFANIVYWLNLGKVKWNTVHWWCSIGIMIWILKKCWFRSTICWRKSLIIILGDLHVRKNPLTLSLKTSNLHLLTKEEFILYLKNVLHH